MGVGVGTITIRVSDVEGVRSLGGRGKLSSMRDRICVCVAAVVVVVVLIVALLVVSVEVWCW